MHSLRRVPIVFFLCLFLCSKQAQADTAEAEFFVKDVASNVIKILKDKNSPLSVRKRKFRDELRRSFAMGAIANFAAGRYLRSMSEEQKTTYRKLFFDAVVENYASQFDDYDDENFSVLGSREIGRGGVIVNGRIIRPGKGAPINVQWKVYPTKDRGLKVTDIILDNVSMAQSLRNEYADVIASRGIDGLLQYLRNKIAQDSASA